MAVMQGYSGSVKISTNVVLEIDKWSLTFGPNMVDTASFGDAWEEKSTTLKKWSGTFSGRLDTADATGHAALSTAALNGTSVALRLYVSASQYYSGTAFVTPSLDAAVDNEVGASYAFTGSGALTFT